MADPVGIAGTAAGLVSLGLQLYGGISKYLDAVRARDEDLAFAEQNLEHLKRTIDDVQAASSRWEGICPNSSPPVVKAVNWCRTQLDALQQLLSELQRNTDGASGSDRKAALRAKRKQYAYPFKRESISKLEKRLQISSDALQRALQVLGLYVYLFRESCFRFLRKLMAHPPRETAASTHNVASGTH